MKLAVASYDVFRQFFCRYIYMYHITRLVLLQNKRFFASRVQITIFGIEIRQCAYYCVLF